MFSSQKTELRDPFIRNLRQILSRIAFPDQSNSLEKNLENSESRGGVRGGRKIFLSKFNRTNVSSYTF